MNGWIIGILAHATGITRGKRAKKESKPQIKMMHNSKTAILVIDMINDFVKNKKCSCYSSKFRLIILPIQKFLKKGNERGIPIIFVCDHHKSANTVCVKKWGLHAMHNTDGWKIIDELSQFSRMCVSKEYYDSFFRSQLHSTLQRLNVTQILLCGVQTNCCIRATVESGYYRGYIVKVISDCVADENVVSHKIGLRTISSLSGSIIDSDKWWRLYDNE